MFSKDPKEPPQEVKTKLQEPHFPSKVNNPLFSSQKPEIEENKPEVVTVVEKISGVLSPYFVVLVGLYLYDNDSWFSFLLGTILIITGVLSIFKISQQDFNSFFNWVKKTLGYDEEPRE